MPRTDAEFLKVTKDALIATTAYRIRTTKRAERRRLAKDTDLAAFLSDMANITYADIASRIANRDEAVAQKLLAAVEAMEQPAPAEG